MKNKQANISHLNKYLNGKLDPSAMHKLERDALNDPFLAEALEGYEAIGKDQTPALEELKARLRKRISKKKKVPVIAIQVFAIAASILLLLTLGTIYLTRSSKKTVALIAMKPRSKTALPTSQDSSSATYSRLQKNENLADRAVASAPLAAKASADVSSNHAEDEKKTKSSGSSQSTILLADRGKARNRQLIARNSPAPPVVMSDATPKTAPEPAARQQQNYMDAIGDTSNLVVTALGIKRQQQTLGYSTTPSLDKKASHPQDSSIHNALAGKAAGVTVAQANAAPGASPRILLRGISSISKEQPPLYVVDGIPTSDTSNLNPSEIRSTTVLKGEGARALYGSRAANGVILITTSRNRSRNTNKDSISSKAVAPLYGYNEPKAGSSLNEVVVTRKSYNYYEAPDTSERLSPLPLKGWDFYNHYLKTHELNYVEEGKVRVSFMVNSQGSLDQFKIIKSLNPDADAKAIEIIKKGPRWLGNSDHTSGKVTLTIRFRGSE